MKLSPLGLSASGSSRACSPPSAWYVLLSLTTLSTEFVDVGAPVDQYFQTLGATMLSQYHGLVDVGLVLAFSLGSLLYYVVFFRSKLIPTWL